MWDHREIERDARAAAREVWTPPVPGDRVAWTLHGYAGHAEGVSEIHRVYDKTMTYCEEQFPVSPYQFLPLMRSLLTCRTCKERHAAGWQVPVEVEATNDSHLARSVA